MIDKTYTCARPSAADVDTIMNFIKEAFERGLDHLLVDTACRTRQDWISENYDFLSSYGAEISCGCTKLVIKNIVEGWVIKLPFKLHIDYCACEADYYADAVEQDLAFYFAAVYKIGECNGISIYVQEYMDMYEDSVSSTLARFIADNYLNGCDFKSEDDMWDAAYDEVEDLETYEVVDILTGSSDVVDFVTHNEINDLHTGNWGYSEKRGWIMVDYSGYHE